MAVKYTLNYKDYHNNTCIVNIEHASYTGTAIPLKGVGKQAVIIERECGDDPYEAIINTRAIINVYQEEHSPIDVFELQTAKDREFAVTFTINGQVRFKGWLNADGLQQPFAGAPFALQLTAIDGLTLLKDIPYIHNNLPGGRCIINYIRQILLGIPNLASNLPIRWYCKVKNLEYPDQDVFSGSVNWSTRGEGYNDYNGTIKDCMYILENMLKSFQCRIVQTDGFWTIYRINDMIDDAGNLVVFKNITGLDTFTIMDSDYFVPLKTIGSASDDYHMVEKDHVLMVKPALKRVVTKYDQNQRDNILPNGNMDLTIAGLSPLYWIVTPSDAGVLSAQNSLYENGGYSLEVQMSHTKSGIVTNGPLPIDTDTLYTYIEFGFKFVVTQWAGVDANGYIIWGEQSPFTVSIQYDANGVTYYLNEFGFWTLNSILLPVEVPNLKVGDVAQLSFNKNGDISIPIPINPIGRTQAPSIAVYFNLRPNLVVRFDDVYLKTDTNNDVYEAVYGSSDTNTAKEDYTLEISSSHNGFYLSNYMSNYYSSGVEKFYNDGVSQGTLTELHSRAVLRNRYEPSIMFEGSIYSSDYMYAEIYAIKSLNGKVFLPLASSWNTETNVVRLTCIESRNDNIPISVSHYGSNDKTRLSN